MTRSMPSVHKLWRKSSERGGYYQILGRKDVVRPEGAPLKLPRSKLTRAQRQVILDWYWGTNSDYSAPINSLSAVSAQLKVSAHFFAGRE